MLAGAAALSTVGAVTLLANGALTRHDAHFDLTRERVFTPDADAMSVVEHLDRPVQLTYFYREDDPDGKRARHIVELMSRHSSFLRVTTVDPARNPSLARTAGVRFSNVALLEADGRRVIVHSTDETDIAIGIERVLRERVVEICFLSGHGEYPSDNYEFHTHIEALGGEGGHSHGAAPVVETTGHGVGRFRRSLEAVGYEIREITPARDGTIDRRCRVVIDAGPQTPYSPIESKALETYLRSGGAALLLYDLGFAVAPAHDALLRRLGLSLPAAVVVDSDRHYASDPKSVAVTAYESHPVTRRMSLTFYPGVRPLEAVVPANGITREPLFASSDGSHRQPLMAALSASADGAHHPQGSKPPPGPHLLAAAIRGKLDATAEQTFRLIVVGDSDFVSNSFYPYMSNNRIALSMVRWLVGETESASVAPRIPVQPTVELTNYQRRALFLSLVVALPLTIAGIGALVWWRRR
jgi:hypothetical protein